MRIACLGWGSLVWNPRTFPIQRYWFPDGPLLPIEFARQSSGGRITLVITPGAREVRVLWALMSVNDKAEAVTALASREGVRPEDAARFIGRWELNPTDAESPNQVSASISSWANKLGLDGTVWTNLPPKFGRDARVPTADEVITFLRNRTPTATSRAEEYVRRAPRQIDTEYRRHIEAELGWTATDT